MRLTDKDAGLLIDQVYRNGKHMDCKEQTGSYSKDLLEEAINKLADYEDIGEPHELKQLQAERDKYKEALEHIYNVSTQAYIRSKIKEALGKE